MTQTAGRVEMLVGLGVLVAGVFVAVWLERPFVRGRASIHSQIAHIVGVVVRLVEGRMCV